MSEQELRREVERARRRKQRLLWFVIAGQLALIGWLVRPREHDIVQTSRTTVVPMPAPLPIVERVINVPTDRTACPPPRTEALVAKPAEIPDYKEILHVRPSATNAGWIAAWNETHVFISMNAGASWKQTLDGPGTVSDVAFDCFGRVIVTREEHIGIQEGTTERWLSIPDLEGSAKVIGGGPDIVLVGHAPRPNKKDPWMARLAVSSDDGTSWRYQPLAEYWGGQGIVHGRQHEDGTVLAMIPLADCMHDNPYVFRWRDGEFTHIETEVSADLQIFGDRLITDDEWQQIGSTKVHEMKLGSGTIIGGGPDPILLTNDAAYRIVNGKAKRLPWVFNNDEINVSADPAGRIWSVMCGQPHVSTREMPISCEVKQ